MTEGGLKSFSPARVVASVSNTLLRWVGQRTILGFIALELLMASFLSWWLIKHKRIAFLGIFIYNWKTYIIFAVIRLTIAFFGFYSVWIRRIFLTKVYYGLFFLSFILAIWTAIPVHLLECNCTDYLQCGALATFADPGRVLNPHHPPEWRYFESKRSVKYKEPPMDVDLAEPFTEKHLDHDRAGLLVVLGGSLLEKTEGELAAEAAAEAAAAMGSGRLVNKRRRQPLAITPDAAAAQHPMKARRMLGALQLHASTKRAKAKRRGKRGPADHEEALREKVDKPSIFFNVTDARITWAGDERPSCENTSLSAEEAGTVKERLARALRERQLSEGQGGVLDDFLPSKLVICTVDSSCGGVSARVLEVNAQSFLKVCQHALQLVPVLSGEEKQKGRVDQGLGAGVIYFQRNPTAINTVVEEHGARVEQLYQYAFRRLPADKAVDRLRVLQRSSCYCDPDEGGCNFFEDALGEPRSWCYVKWSRVEICLKKGVQMFWDKNEKKAWSQNLCEEASCDCSDLGIHPMRLNDPNLNMSLLDKNHVNYGGSCKRWNNDDKKPWCYVGWDSVCADRLLRTKFWRSKEHPSWQDMHMQYESHLPCGKHEQEEEIEATESICQDVSRIVELFMVINILLFVPMMVIIFKFLSNRCGDEFQCEEQFAVVLSTDDEESEEEERRPSDAGAAAGAAGK